MTVLLLIGVPAVIVAGGRMGARGWQLAGFGLAALILTVVLGNTQREQYLDNRYKLAVAPPLETGFRSTPEWRPIQKFGTYTNDARIGVVGRASAFGQYFFYGDDLSNHVQYLGEELRRGTFRQISRCGLLRRVINKGDYDYIVVTPRIRRETSIPPELFWIGEDSAAKPLVRTGGAAGDTGDLAGIFQLEGELDPSTCATAVRTYRATKVKEGAARQAEIAALERSTGEDVDLDGVVGQ